MDLYEYILEDGIERHFYYYSYEEKPDAVIAAFMKGLPAKTTISIVDVFPEPYQKTFNLAEPLQINTVSKIPMFLPTGFTVTVHTMYRVLFEYITND